MGHFFGSAITRALQKILGVASGLLIFDVFTGLWLSTPTSVQKVMIMSNVFVLALVLLVINTGCP